MDERPGRIRNHAENLLVALSGQQAMPGVDPIVELISFLLAGQSEDTSLPDDSSLSMENWLRWNDLALSQPGRLSQAIDQVMIRETMDLPQEQTTLRVWAAWLVLTVLDQYQMA
jgi:hypothetical protein